MFTFAFDPSLGVLHVRVGEGIWTLAEIDRYAREAGPQFAAARKQAGRLRLLVDLAKAAILTQELMEPLGKAGMQFARSDDRVALVVGSTLLKLQMKRMIGAAPTPIFLSVDEAVTWLTVVDDAKASVAH